MLLRSKTAKKAWATPYIEVEDDDDEDELSISPAVPLVPRGRTTSSFRPATVTASGGMDKEERWDDDWSTGTSTTQFTSSGQASTAAASHPMSISRSTDRQRPTSLRPRRPSSAFEGWEDDNLTFTETSSAVDPFEVPPEDASPDFGASASEHANAHLYEYKPAWTAPKVVELKGNKGGSGGLFETSMWDFEDRKSVV